MVSWPKLLSKSTSTRPLPARLATVALPSLPRAASVVAPLTAPVVIWLPCGVSVRVPVPLMAAASRRLRLPSVASVSD